jgi:hypothetical protein
MSSKPTRERAASLVASGGVQAAAGKGCRTGEAPQEVSGGTVIASTNWWAMETGTGLDPWL